MKQISTGAGLLGLGSCILAATCVATLRQGGEAFAQGTGTERRIVAQGVYSAADPAGYLGRHWGYRIWSDNVTKVTFVGTGMLQPASDGSWIARVHQTGQQDYPNGAWRAIDSGSSSFFASDLDWTGQMDSADVTQVLLNFNETFDQPPPIDCTVNAPR